MDELDFHTLVPEASHTSQDDNSNMHDQLSPIEEERCFPAPDAPLQVHVTAKFHDPAIRCTYDRTYHSSHSFIPAERTCRGLMRRIEHCSEELITRKDPDALNATQCLHKGPKPLRFELLFQVVIAGHSGIWAERSFKSHQKHALTSSLAKEVLQSTHRIVGMFLRRHDKDFEWTEEPAHDHFPDKPETFNPSINGTLSLACVPRSLFIESSQTWEFVPGYSLELTFKSSNPARLKPEIRKTLKVDSKQNTPLNLGLAEDLLWQAYRSVHDVLDQKKSSFDLEHASCDGFDGVPDCDCQHFDKDALDIGLRIVNNLGPVYDHLHRSVQSRLRLFAHSNGQDCDEFIHKIQARLDQFRDGTDKKMGKLNDFDFRIAELKGHGWHEKDCARFIIDGKHSYSRRSIQAVLDRIRTGVGDILRGNDVAIRIIAYKRGHLILDKALIARHHQQTPGPGPCELSKYQRQSLLGLLKTGIQHDIDMICKDTCSIDDILEAGPPAISPSRPCTPCDTPQRQIRLESRGSFAKRQPTPSEIPATSSSRIFPLVPVKYRGKKQSSQEASSMRGSTVGIDCHDDFRFLGNDRDIINDTNQGDALKSAAEVYPASKRAYETDSSSTHSSIPTLTESDTPSPEQSMLITPSCVRSSSPFSHGLPSIEDLRAHQFSSPFVVDTSAPNSATFSEVDRFEDPKVACPKNTVLPSGDPGTPKHPETEKSVPVNTPKTLGDVSGDEKTPVPHRCMQGPFEPSELEDVGKDVIPQDVAAESEPSRSASRSLPTKGWLLCCVEEISCSETTAGTYGRDAMPVPVAECDSSETLRPSTIMQQPSTDDLAGLRDNRPIKVASSTSAPVSEPPCLIVSEGTSNTKLSVPTAQSELISEADSDENSLKVMTLDDELSRSKLDFFEQDEESTIDAAPTGHQYAIEDIGCTLVGLRQVGMSDGSGTTGHVIPFSDSGIDTRTGSETTDKSGPEFEEKDLLSPINESAFEFVVDSDESPLQNSQTNLTEPEPKVASVPLICAGPRRGDGKTPVRTKDLSMNAAEKPEDPSEDPRSAPIQVSDPVKLPKVRTSVPVCTARVVSNPQPSPAGLGLNSARLLPSLPIFTSFRSVSHDPRTSWSSSSSWEDYVSTGRHSSDSVDTIKPSPASSHEDDHPDSPKRLGTPTAGLLGLHESRWAEFGIRTALTARHTLDRPSTAPVPDSPESSHCDATPRVTINWGDDKRVHETATSPRKPFHLRQKKSIGSIILSNKTKRKESKELRKQKSIELESLKQIKSKSQESAAFREVDDGSARFPRAMMLVAGLAFASSVVSRNHS